LVKIVFNSILSHQNEFKKVLLSSPHAICGKRGLTDDFLNHVKQLLKRYKTIKIKVLKSIATKANIAKFADQLSQATNSYVLDVRGKMVIISLYNLKKKN
jgi:RNA-binding protein YhbY